MHKEYKNALQRCCDRLKRFEQSISTDSYKRRRKAFKKYLRQLIQRSFNYTPNKPWSKN